MPSWGFCSKAPSQAGLSGIEAVSGIPSEALALSDQCASGFRAGLVKSQSGGVWLMNIVAGRGGGDEGGGLDRVPKGCARVNTLKLVEEDHNDRFGAPDGR